MHRQDSKSIFDPSLISDEFDPAIIAMFEHENDGIQSPFDMLVTAYGQYRDMYQAYLYAKQDVLPTIRKAGLQSVTPAKLLAWLNQAHARIAASIAGPSRMIAGQYSTKILRRWHWGMLTSFEVDLFVGGDDTREAKIIEFANKFDASPENVTKIINVLRKIRSMKELSYIDKLGMEYDEATRPYARGQTKFIEAYEKKLLSASEFKILDELVAFGTKPEEIPAAMKKFSILFVRAWRACDVNNREQLASLLLMGYKGVAGIHPYGNGNGRTATWLMNIVLRSLNMPSILMRERGEKFNTKSSYSEAIREIDTNPDVFKRHVLQRIDHAIEHGFLECEIECKIVAKRFEIYDFLKEKIMKFDEDQRNVIADCVMSDVESNMFAIFGRDRCVANEPLVMLYAVEEELMIFQKIDESLGSLAKPPAVLSPVVLHQYSTKEVGEIKNILEKKSGMSGWKNYSKGTIMLLTLDDISQARKIVAALAVMNGMTVSLAKTKPEGKPVVKITDINLRKLRSWADVPAPQIETLNSNLKK